MNAQLVRYVALALRPGLVTPTRDERCMQIAFVAKLNSGCISRQVGAVVADADHSIHSLGWNDTPKGQTPCLLRNVSALLSSSDSDSFQRLQKPKRSLGPILRKNSKVGKSSSTVRGCVAHFALKTPTTNPKAAIVKFTPGHSMLKRTHSFNLLSGEIRGSQVACCIRRQALASCAPRRPFSWVSRRLCT